VKLSFEIKIERDVTVVRCTGRFVYRDEALSLLHDVAELLPRTKEMVLELSGVEAIDGAGLGGLIALLARAQGSGCDLKLVAPNRHVLEVLELTGVAPVFGIHPSVEAMLSARAHAG
jgi:anti-anti-sigma factor